MRVVNQEFFYFLGNIYKKLHMLTVVGLEEGVRPPMYSFSFCEGMV